jgi:tagatose-6-phosphate ketose/aldose isomerase
MSTTTTPGHLTRAEIFQQPELWPDTFKRVRAANLGAVRAPVLTGAGTSAYAAMAIESAWRGSRAVPSTDLFLHYRDYLEDNGTVVSLARSGDSPESVAVVDKIQRGLPGVRHIALTCNANGKLAKWKGVEAVVFDPRTNDRSLVMTSSYTDLVLGGMTLARPDEVEKALPAMCAGWDKLFASHEEKAKKLAAFKPQRMVVLAGAPLFGAAREATLKVLEMTAGRIVPLPETYLGLRHGPMSFSRDDSLTVCFITSDPKQRRYEYDLVRELRAKKLGRIVALGADVDASLFDEVVTTGASALPDYLRTPADIVFPQLLAFYLSVGLGLDPDNPSPGSVITRVVQGVRIHED